MATFHQRNKATKKVSGLDLEGKGGLTKIWETGVDTIGGSS